MLKRWNFLKTGFYEGIIIGFNADPEKADVRFIKYLFDTVLKMRYQSFTQGATQDNLSQSKLLSIRFSVPDLADQKKLADFLSGYDELIVNNRRRMALLEQVGPGGLPRVVCASPVSRSREY